MSKQSNIVNASQDITVNSSGKVGIGTSSPAYKLVVSNDGASGIEFGPAYSGTSNLVQHYNRSGATYVDAVNDAAQHRFNTSGTERMRIDSAGRVTMPYQPCFSAKGSGLMSWSAGSTVTQIVALTSVATNVGGYFSTGTYRFTAPVAGNYLFAAKATQTGAVGGPSLFITKNGTAYGYETSIGYGVAYHSFGGEVIIPMAANDWVDMRITNNNNVALTIDKSRCSLSGFLIG